ncbi:MAG: bifunctional diaminohydroxyphosphoribosylaminopyrimidine deaminase/5-amino-6-(5-phosphoribosylamino)uracil reductase RibD [Chlorobiaceae bacterium]|nr:bifunctional diaminohydroxyphosphoribosylaminopyrimidine deaminase/5-amino-6-(5-phosphoribosylamino)uracil reductase RibD [Chlorobiaceae bacterium]
MRRCLELAARGAGMVSPNPMVGSVVVHQGRIIGEGWHQRYGEAHAEVNAIGSVREPELLPESVLYVNLEPCSHFGKTPPCADLIVGSNIRRVVVGCLDPHDKVAGKGIATLEAAGIDVTVGVLEDESERLNEAFITSHRKGRPFVALKIAQTLDGRIATALGASKWITGPDSRTEVHRLRSRYDAVLSSSSTIIADDAELTVRHCDGRHPIRVLLDRRLQVPIEAKVFNDQAETIVFAAADASEPCRIKQLNERDIDVVTVGQSGSGLDLGEVFAELHRRKVLSVMVEGGSRLCAALVRARLVDKYYVFVAPKFFGGDGLPSFSSLDVVHPEHPVRFRFAGCTMFGDDLLVEAYPA